MIFEDKLDDFFKEFKAGRKMVLSTSLPNERLFCITPTYIERWIYIHKMPFLETFHFEKKSIIYKNINWLNFIKPFFLL